MAALIQALPPAPARRWFHGGCVKVGQAEVDMLGAAEWACQPCKAYRRQVERAAARSQR